MKSIRYVLLTAAGIIAASGSGLLADGPPESRTPPRSHAVAGTRVSGPVGQSYNRASIVTRGQTAPASLRAPVVHIAGPSTVPDWLLGSGVTSRYPMSYQVLGQSLLPQVRDRGFGVPDTRKASNDIRRLIRKLDLEPL